MRANVPSICLNCQQDNATAWLCASVKEVGLSLVITTGPRWVLNVETAGDGDRGSVKR